MASEVRTDPSGSVTQERMYSVRKAFLLELSKGRRKMWLVSWKHSSRTGASVWPWCDHQGPTGSTESMSLGRMSELENHSETLMSNLLNIKMGRLWHKRGMGLPKVSRCQIRDEEQVFWLCRKRSGTAMAILQKRRLRPKKRWKHAEVAKRVCGRPESISGFKAPLAAARGKLSSCRSR